MLWAKDPTMPLRFASSRLASALPRLGARVREGGGRLFVVGGSARDAQRDLPVAELDLEVFGLGAEALQALLRPTFEAQRVGQHFPVLRLRGLPVDIAWAKGDGNDLEAAARRRDFTLNALYLDAETGECIDPLGGIADLEAGVLRHAGDRFAEDPLRILRGMQLAARFDLRGAPETLAFCQKLSLDAIAPERIFEEWRKLLLRGRTPSRGLAFLKDAGGLAFFPELEPLVGCAQDPEFHPEGDVWTHTAHALDAFARERTGLPREDLVVGLAVLGHDFGKPATSAPRKGDETGKRVRSPGHAQKSVSLVRRFLERMTQEHKLIDEVAVLVEHHLAPAQFARDGAGDAAVRRLARKVGRIDRLVRVSLADYGGRPPLLPDTTVAGGWLLERAAALRVTDTAPAPLVTGRDLLATSLGLREGRELGRVLEAVYEAQLDGQIQNTEEGIELARAIVGPV